MASTSKVMEVSSVPMVDSSIAEMKTQHDDAMQEDPERYKADKDWDFAFVLEKLRDTKCSLLLERFFDSNTLLHVAASVGHDQIVEAILSKQQCQELLTAKNSSGDLPLHVAVNAEHLPIVQQLLDSSYPCEELLTAKNSSGNLPLHIAVNAGHLPIVQLLVESSSCSCKLLKEENKEGITPLHLALIKNFSEEDKYTEVAEFLSEIGLKAGDSELKEFEAGFCKSPPGYKACLELLFK